MEGNVLGFDPTAQNGVIKGADGKRYSFARAEWKSEHEPHTGDHVDFEAKGDTAASIYLLKSANPLAGMLDAIPMDAIKQCASEFTQRVNTASHGDVKGHFLSRLENILAALLLVAFFMPWVSYFGLASSGMGMHSVAKQMSEMMEFANQLGGARAGKHMGGVYMLYLVYLVPVFAVLTIWYNLQNIKKPFALIAGIVPFALLLLALFKIGSDIFKVLDYGAYLSLLAGGGMLATVFGYLKSPFKG